MAYQMKVNSGTMFKNDQKRGDKSPDYRGEANINGKVMRLAGWARKGKTKGTPYISIAFQDSDGGQRSSSPAPSTPATNNGMPF